MGYVGLEQQSNPGGADIRTRATRQTLADGQIRVLNTPEEIGFPPSVKSLRAGIIVPLHRGEAIIGTLKFYFRSPREITENQIALAEGLEGKVDLSLVKLNINTEKWTEADGYYYYNEVLKPGETTAPLFTTVTFDGTMDNLYQNCTTTISVAAQATQSANNGTSALTATGWPEA